MQALVGYTGFVGSNIYETKQFDVVYNSQNIEEAYGLKPERLIYAGLRAEKYLANQSPENDMKLIRQAKINIEKIQPEKLVLISTIDVFKEPWDVNEHTRIDTQNLHAYGYNRYQLEEWVRERYPDALIVRLPGLFGKNMKKNFIYDYINIIPFMLKKEKMSELSQKDDSLAGYYQLQDNGYYKLMEITREDRRRLKAKFCAVGFSALNFTDSRSIFQFYPLRRLGNDIETALANGLTIWHPAVEPLSVSELFRFLSGNNFVNELPGVPAYYNCQTAYAELFGGNNGYICTKEEVCRQIKEFVDENMYL